MRTEQAHEQRQPDEQAEAEGWAGRDVTGHGGIGEGHFGWARYFAPDATQAMAEALSTAVDQDDLGAWLTYIRQVAGVR